MGALAGSDVVPRLIAERPLPEWRLGPFTVVVGEEQARLRYAREPVGTACAPTPPTSPPPGARRSIA
jgi:hypothetical protein